MSAGFKPCGLLAFGLAPELGTSVCAKQAAKPLAGAAQACRACLPLAAGAELGVLADAVPTTLSAASPTAATPVAASLMEYFIGPPLRDGVSPGRVQPKLRA